MSELARTVEALLFLSPDPVRPRTSPTACDVSDGRPRRGARGAARGRSPRAAAASSCARSRAA